MEIFGYWDGLPVQYAFTDACSARVSENNKKEALEPSHWFSAFVCLYISGNLLRDRASECKILADRFFCKYHSDGRYMEQPDAVFYEYIDVCSDRIFTSSFMGTI